MIRSMTAFARCDRSVKNCSLTWEIRTVNHRYLEPTLRLPDGFRSKENDFKEIVRQQLSRGKVDATLRYDSEEGEQVSAVNVNEAMVQVLLDAQDSVKALTQGAGNLTVSQILSWPGVVKPESLDFEALFKDAGELLEVALKDLVESREKEGARLVAFIEQRCQQIEEIVVLVTARREEVVKAARERLLLRIEGLDLEFDPTRLEQELAVQAQRLDVSEELDRLSVHAEELRDLLKNGDAVGRRLDFLMQELNREANTLGSKSHDAETTKHSMDLKVLIEQMREQIQNIE